MKKYFSIIVAVLLAAMALSLASCSKDDDDDDDAPSGGKKSVGELVINGETVSFKWMSASLDEESCMDYAVVMLDFDGVFYEIGIHEDITEFSKGDDVSETLGFMIDGVVYANVASGSVIVKSIDSNSVTLSFEDTELESAYTPKHCTISGKIKVPINGEYGSFI